MLGAVRGFRRWSIWVGSGVLGGVGEGCSFFYGDSEESVKVLVKGEEWVLVLLS